MRMINYDKPAKQLLRILALIIFLGQTGLGLAAEKTMVKEDGEALFNTYCIACHLTTDEHLIGPGLKGVEDRYSREWIQKWVKDSQSLIESGDAEAISVFEQYNEVLMPAQDVNNDQLDAIINYVITSNGGVANFGVAGGASDEGEEVEEEGAVMEESTESANDGNAENGEKVFKSYCAACHTPGTKQLVGPGLAGVGEKYDRSWIYKWVKNSKALIESGDADAIAVYEENGKVDMPMQPVTDSEIDDILAYVVAYAEAVPEAAAETTTADNVVGADEPTSPFVVLSIIIVLLIVIAILRKVQYIMTAADAKAKGDEVPEEASMMEALKRTILHNKTIFALLGIVVLVLFAKVGWNAALGVGVYTGYQPEQPIKFSHELHAGQNGIDCNYCHNSARFSKSAGIPSPNLCMNCHTYISEGPQYGTEEIQKIYDALDFDPVTKTYGEDQKPIKWVKVHNLPDHVYFNHSQHVTVGKIACQKCHGPVETYTVGKQHEPLTMGWCINCHRETKVQMEDNGYYDEIHKRLPEDLKKEYLEDGTITVSELGGIECVKCHY